MNESTQLESIDEVIQSLDEIVNECKLINSTMGYFAALYKKVTLKVKEGIDSNYFDDGPKMEQLDIVFAKRYIDAYNSWQSNHRITRSWEQAFSASKANNHIVLQHLLLGMNAHINLDLGIAAASVSTNSTLDDLNDDFMKINEILSSMVNEIQDDLANIWPFLKKILRKTSKVDNFFIDFSMELARDGAWRFAKELCFYTSEKHYSLINLRDIKVAQKADMVTKPGKIISLIFQIIRLGERGKVGDRIEKLS